MNKPSKRFYNQKDLFLTKYAFYCGYIEEQSSKTKTVQMYQEHCTWNVRMFTYDEGSITWKERIWNTFDEDEFRAAKSNYFQFLGKCDLIKKSSYIVNNLKS